jgi:hypothetical protein
MRQVSGCVMTVMVRRRAARFSDPPDDGDAHAIAQPPGRIGDAPHVPAFDLPEVAIGRDLKHLRRALQPGAPGIGAGLRIRLRPIQAGECQGALLRNARGDRRAVRPRRA